MKKVDRNHSLIVRDLRRVGAIVQSTAELGKGMPDILVAWKGRNFLFEIKDPMQPASKQRLTPHEKEFHQIWKTAGQVDVIRTTEEALEIMK